VLLRDSGLIRSLMWAAETAGLSGGAFVTASFLICAVFSTATGTSLGTILVCAPLLYPAASGLDGDPAFTIGAVIAGATFGDNISPISDTTIASATTQGADMGGVVRSRLRYALPAGLVAVVTFALLGRAATEGTQAAAAAPPADPIGLVMLAAPALVLVLLVRGRHLVEGLLSGVVAASVLGVVLARFEPSDLMGIDRENFIATGLLLDGMRRAVGVSVFTLLLMGLVGGIEASGLLRRLIEWVRGHGTSSGRAEWWIFGVATAATMLTTHSGVAILTVGPLTKDVGEAADVHPYRRANILDVTVCTYPFLLPFFIPTILAASMTGDVSGMPRLSPWAVGLHNVHSWGLLVVIVVAIASGWGRRPPDIERGR
jgi:Na+/H+ antiporter NhaC